MRFSDWSSDVCSSDLSSAGLNLGFDRYRYSFVGRDWGDATSPVRIAAEWTGPTPLDASLEIAGRQGCDVNPLDPSATADRERLLSYVWPDQPERLARIAAALDAAAAAGTRVERADRSEEHTSELQSLMRLSYAVFFLKKKQD